MTSKTCPGRAYPCNSKMPQGAPERHLGAPNTPSQVLRDPLKSQRGVQRRLLRAGIYLIGVPCAFAVLGALGIVYWVLTYGVTW